MALDRAQINRVPVGLFDILQLKSNDLRPQDVDQFMHTTMDITDFFTHPRFSVRLANNAAANSAGDNADIAVPPDEFWLVYAMQGRLVSAQAGDVLSVSVGIQAGTGGFMGLAWSGLPLTATAASQNVRAPITFPRPLILNSSFTIRATTEVCDLVVGNTTVSCNALVSRFGPARP